MPARPGAHSPPQRPAVRTRTSHCTPSDARHPADTMVNYNGDFKLTSSENFDEYMKAVGEWPPAGWCRVMERG